MLNLESLREKLVANEKVSSALQNLALCALQEDYEPLALLSSRKPKPIYVSFENKDLFSNKENVHPK